MSSTITCCNPCCDATFTYGHNPIPRWGGETGCGDGSRCCDTCNNQVIECRLGLSMLMADKDDEVDGLKCALAFYLTKSNKQVDATALKVREFDALTKKLEVAKGCITKLGETAKTAQEDIRKIQEDGCVAPMIDRIMEDAERDIQVERTKIEGLTAELADGVKSAKVGYRITHNLIQGLIGGALREQDQLDDWGDWRVGTEETLGEDFHFNINIPQSQVGVANATVQDVAADNRTTMVLITDELNKHCRGRKNRTREGIAIGFGTCGDVECHWTHLTITDGDPPVEAQEMGNVMAGVVDGVNDAQEMGNVMAGVNALD